MRYQVLVDVYEKLENTSSKISKTEIVADILSKTSIDDLSKVVLLIQGIVYPKFTGYELGIATQMMIRAISRGTGFSIREVEEKFKETGDLGLVAENLIKSRKQMTFFVEELTVDSVFKTLRKLAIISGVGSQERKLNLIAQLLTSAKPREAKYIVRTILGELRVGVAEGIIRDAIVQAFLVQENMSKEDIRKITDSVEYAWNLLSDLGEVAMIAKEKGVDGLLNVKPVIGRPLQVMLGLAAKSIGEILEKYGKIAAEWKYDGMRTIIEKKGDDIWLFTRRLENVTKQFPDIVELARKGLNVEECIVEGETIGIDPKTGLPLPFQQLSQRIHRKYDIMRMVREIPVQVNLFDILYLNGETLFNKTYVERRSILEKIVNTIPEKFQLTKQLISSDVKEIEKFYHEALNAKQEGLMLKVLDSQYIFGRHVGGWYKIKPIMETLDLVIIGAEWGKGSRAKWLSSYILGARDPDTGNFLPCGMMGTGLTEEQFERMTEILKPLIISERGRVVEVRPKIVVEIAYQEIQKSSNYASGFALRFPRLVRIRDDKGPDEADTIERVKKLYESQGRAG